MRTRPNAFSMKGVVSSSSLQSSMAGVRILESGGNIVDAAIATSSTLCVTQNNLCGLGGDAFILLKMNGEPVIDINGSGRAFSSMSAERFIERGINQLPPRGKDAVLTVPGLVRVWQDIHKRYGTMEIKELLNAAHTLARDGFPVTQNYSESIAISSKHLGQFENWRSIFMKDGSAPSPGSIFRQVDLAHTFEHLMSDGLSSFYDGYLADKIVKGLNELGVEISSGDMKEHESTFQEPLRTEYDGYDVYETAPNSQAGTVILWLNILESMGTDPTLGDILKSGHLAYSQRDKYITDPTFHPFPKDFTSKEFARKILENAISPGAVGNLGGDRGDTTYFSITDSEGNSISMIQSNYMGFGSGIVPSGTGFVLQNRGSYFSLDPRHHNVLRPCKRTFHTLCAAMIEGESGYIASLGSMGGDIQPQLHVQLILGLMKNRNDPQSVIDAPRWAFPYTIYERPNEFLTESGELLEEIRRLYPERHVKNVGLSSHLGQSQITSRLENGVVVGGADPRGDGVSIPVG